MSMCGENEGGWSTRPAGGVIPENALKAAARALERHLPEGFSGCAWWCGDDGDNADEHLALVALTAAQDHLDIHRRKISRDPTLNIELAARTLHANTFDSLENGKDWADMSWAERNHWRTRVMRVLKAAQTWNEEDLQ